MAFSRTASRSNLTYLRRRPKRKPAQVPAAKPTPAAAPTPPSTGPKIDTRHHDTSAKSTPKPSAPAKPTPTPPVPPKFAPKPPAPTPVASPKPPAPTPLASPETAPPSPEPPSTGPSLVLRRPAAKPERSLPEAKRVHGRVLLTAESPTVTLDRRQSAIGSLAFELTGSGEVSAVWELTDGTTGMVDAASNVTTSPEYGRRPIVELTGHRVLIGLRQVRQLRRLLILLSRFEGTAPERLIMDLHDESTLETSHTSPDQPVVAALAIYQVDGELVIRREGASFDSVDGAAAAYGLTVNWLPPVRR